MLSAVALVLTLILARVHVAAQANDCLLFVEIVYFWEADCLVVETCFVIALVCLVL
jgi:hypothetical protein